MPRKKTKSKRASMFRFPGYRRLRSEKLFEELRGGTIQHETIAERFRRTRVYLGYGTPNDLAEELKVQVAQIRRIEAGKEIPSGTVLIALGLLGADLHYLVHGRVAGGTYRPEQGELHKLFGANVPHMSPGQLLGALLCQRENGGLYRIGANPYKPYSPHHSDVAIGWRMARAVINGDTTALPGTL